MYAVLSYHYKKYKVPSLPSLTLMETLSYVWYKFLLSSGIIRPPPPENNYSDLPAVSKTLFCGREIGILFVIFKHLSVGWIEVVF